MKALKLTLVINAVSSGVTGILLLGFNNFFSALFDIQADRIFLGCGVFLIVFALLVFYESRKPNISEKSVWIITSLDISWVIGSIVILLLLWNSLSLIGNLLIIIVALWVASMACFQIKYGLIRN